MPDNDIALIAHLMRRAAFGATRKELEAYAAKGYEATVEELLYPENAPDLEYDILERYMEEVHDNSTTNASRTLWFYRMIVGKRPLAEKMALFWHGVMCTGDVKVYMGRMMGRQGDMFRHLGLGSFRTLLVQLARDPAMSFYLDNWMSHKGSINENFGRELLELFSMGVGMDGSPNYTEDDVKECARAFTGWTYTGHIPRWPYELYGWHFQYDPTDHDHGEKTFLGETGRWNGEDIIDIIVRQPACARFICRHLYNFFVADEPQVPQWTMIPPQDMEAIKTLEQVYFDNNGEIRPVLRVLFNSNFFKNARFTKVKSPVELVVGVIKQVGFYQEGEDFKPGLRAIADEPMYTGQQLYDPPTVEGWHHGNEWIDSGTLLERINWSAEWVGRTELPGVKDIVNRLMSCGARSTEEFVDACLDLMGPMEVTEETRLSLIDFVEKSGELHNSIAEEEHIDFTRRVGQVLQMVVATQEYQFG
jgi:uncharacterized protein (DUF1800 family)